LGIADAMPVGHAIPFRLTPTAPVDEQANIQSRLGQLIRLMEDMSSDIRHLRQDSQQLTRQLLRGQVGDPFDDAAAAAVDHGAVEGLSVRLLGGVDIRWQGASLDVPLGRKARMLLAYLAAARPGGCEKNELLGAFWPDSVETRAANNLSIAVHQVRTWLAGVVTGGRDLIAVRQARYALQGPCQVDVEAFRAAASQARRAVATGDSSGARRGFEATVSLYGGEFLALEPCEDWALQIRREMASLYVEAAKWLAREAVQAREWATVIDHAERIQAADDLDEECYQLLMIGHWKSGSRSRAMQAYRDCEERLREALGMAPSPLTRKLEQDVLRG
jgi:DNA-binding SARP family transcriptional activator